MANLSEKEDVDRPLNITIFIRDPSWKIRLGVLFHVARADKMGRRKILSTGSYTLARKDGSDSRQQQRRRLLNTLHAEPAFSNWLDCFHDSWRNLFSSVVKPPDSFLDCEWGSWVTCQDSTSAREPMIFCCPFAGTRVRAHLSRIHHAW